MIESRSNHGLAIERRHQYRGDCFWSMQKNTIGYREGYKTVSSSPCSSSENHNSKSGRSQLVFFYVENPCSTKGLHENTSVLAWGERAKVVFGWALCFFVSADILFRVSGISLKINARRELPPKLSPNDIKMIYTLYRKSRETSNSPDFELVMEALSSMSTAPSSLKVTILDFVTWFTPTQKIKLLCWTYALQIRVSTKKPVPLAIVWVRCSTRNVRNARNPPDRGLGLPSGLGHILPVEQTFESVNCMIANVGNAWIRELTNFGVKSGEMTQNRSGVWWPRMSLYMGEN